MAQLEVFFDYACPYCMRAHASLHALLPRYPETGILWRPCEAHPRPDPYGPHSALCVQGYFFALEHGADLWEYHERMFRAALRDRVDLENPAALAARVEGLLDSGAFLEALEKGTYGEKQRAANDYAYERSGVWVVPAYRMNGKRLDAVENVGVTETQLDDFLRAAQAE